MAGSKPGERRGGRKAGTSNKHTGDVKALAQSYGPRAIREIAKIAKETKNEQTRLAAWRELLDRGYGKPLATATVQETGKIEVIHRVIVDPDPLVIEHEGVETLPISLPNGTSDHPNPNDIKQLASHDPWPPVKC